MVNHRRTIRKISKIHVYVLYVYTQIDGRKEKCVYYRVIHLLSHDTLTKRTTEKVFYIEPEIRPFRSRRCKNLPKCCNTNVST